jgi:hypothetical protein
VKAGAKWLPHPIENCADFRAQPDPDDDTGPPIAHLLRRIDELVDVCDAIYTRMTRAEKYSALWKEVARRKSCRLMAIEVVNRHAESVLDDDPSWFGFNQRFKKD